jgi:hypothetical protein
MGNREEEEEEEEEEEGEREEGEFVTQRRKGAKGKGEKKGEKKGEFFLNHRGTEAQREEEDRGWDGGGYSFPRRTVGTRERVGDVWLDFVMR